MPRQISNVGTQSNFTISDAIVKHIVLRNADKKPITKETLDSRVKDVIQKQDLDISLVIKMAEERIRLQTAQQKIIDNWINQGGPRSPLGLPIDNSFPVQSVGGIYLVPFRGGNIQIDGGLNVLNNDLAPTCRVTFEGLILHSRQETSTDEIYGAGGYRIGSILIGNQVLTGNFVIPEVKLGGKGARNTRVYKTSQEIYRGAPVGFELFVAICEHDSGDREVVRKKVRTLIDEGAKNVAAVLGAGVSGGNLAQVGRIGEQVSESIFYDWLRDATADFITDFFGLSDDPYNPGGLTISADEMASPRQVMIAGHQLDNKTIAYTHRIDMSGIDDSGAVGNCSAYFRVWR